MILTVYGNHIALWVVVKLYVNREKQYYTIYQYHLIYMCGKRLNVTSYRELC